jgi:hypothetical protein
MPEVDPEVDDDPSVDPEPVLDVPWSGPPREAQATAADATKMRIRPRPRFVFTETLLRPADYEPG